MFSIIRGSAAVRCLSSKGSGEKSKEDEENALPATPARYRTNERRSIEVVNKCPEG